MSGKVSNFIKSTKGFMAKHSPEILTGIGVTGMITSTVLAVKATPKALYLLEEAEDIKKAKLTPVEVIKATWKQYIPAAVLGLTSATCIIGASAVNAKRNAALATAYAISERTLLTYRDKVIETIGEKKEKEVREKVAQEEVNNNPVSTSQVIITPKGNTLCFDTMFGRYFKSDVDSLKKAINELNRTMLSQNYVSLNEFYHTIGLEPVSNGYRLGWNIDDGFIDIDYDACLTKENEPCLAIDFVIAPKYNFDKFM